MFAQRSKVFIAALLASVIIASCGGSDASPRQRNAALAGKQQCLSDTGTTISNSGLVQLDFCSQAQSFEILLNGQIVGNKVEIASNSMNYFQAPTGVHAFQVLSYASGNVQVGNDHLQIVNNSCATGGGCKLGDTGPGGGIVVFDALSKMDWGQYIEMARKGWYAFNEGTNASIDPKGNFNCGQSYLGTKNQMGSGKSNTQTWLAACSNPFPSKFPPAVHLVDTYNKSPQSPTDDWVLPTPYELSQIERMNSSLSNLELPTTIATSFEKTPTDIFAYTFGFSQTQPCDQGCTSTVLSSNSFVRPIRYFSPTAATTPTVTVTGMMDAPITTTTSTTQVSTPISTLPLKLEAVLHMDQQLNLAWLMTPSTQPGDYEVSYKKNGGSEVIINNVDCCSKFFNLSEFDRSARYTFVVSYTNAVQGRISSDPIVLEPIVSTSNTTNGNTSKPGSSPSNDSSNGAETPGASPAEEPATTAVAEVTTTVAETTQTTTPTDVNCSVAPNVKTTPNPTSDDIVRVVVFHPCFGRSDSQSVYFGRAEIEEDGREALLTAIRSAVTGESLSVDTRLDPGVHIYIFFTIIKIGEETFYSDEKRVEISVAQGEDSSSNSCDKNNFQIIDEKLVITCPEIWSTELSEYDFEYSNENEIPTKVDARKLIADLSGLSSGWHTLRLFLKYGLDSMSTVLNVCITDCAVGTDFAPFTVDIKDEVFTANLSCSGSVSAFQMFKVDDHLFIQSEEEMANGMPSIETTLRPSTSAMALLRWCEGDGRRVTATFASLDRKTSKPTSEDFSHSEGEIVATVLLPEITDGKTDLPAGEVTGGSIIVTSQAESLAIRPDVLAELFHLTVDGSPVKTVEISTDGKTWLPADIGKIELPKDVSKLSVRLTSDNGTQTVITRDIERAAPASAAISVSSDSASNTMMIVLIILGLLVLVAIALLLNKKRSA